MADNFIEPYGMYNSGIICYFNSAMQALISSKHFMDMIKSNDNVISDEIIKHTQNKDSYNLNIFNAFMAKKNNSFGYNQEDAGEFITLLLEMYRHPFVYTYICDLFCIHCRKTKSLPPDKNIFFYTSPSHIENNTISGNNMIANIKNNYSKCFGVQCTVCGSGKIVKTNRISEISEIILISIQPDFDKKEICNYDSYITFDSGSDRNIYRLIAVIYHSGGKESGHYYSKCLRGDKWYEFNDMQVSLTHYPNPHPNAYLLLYDYIRTDSDAALTQQCI